MPPRKKKIPAASTKRLKPTEEKPYPDADPEWEHLEERYSQIGEDMRNLAKMLGGK